MITKADLQIYKIASTDDSRPALTAVNFTHTGATIVLAATDGYQLTERVVAADGIAAFEEMLIPATTVQGVASLMKPTDRLSIVEDEFIIIDKEDQPRTRLKIGALASGKFTDYAQLIPKPSPAVVLIDPKLLAKALAQHNTRRIEMHVQIGENGHGTAAPVLIVQAEANGTAARSLVMPLKM